MPPPNPAELPLSVLLVSTRMLMLKMPPPDGVAVLPLKVLFVIVSVPAPSL